jgi:hypothetical protein
MIALSEALISRVEESGLDTVTVPLAILSIWGRQKAGLMQVEKTKRSRAKIYRDIFCIFLIIRLL